MLVVEDTVTTTGGSTISAIESGSVTRVSRSPALAVVDRLAGGGEKIAAEAGAPYETPTTIGEHLPGPPDK